jgi:hypothetical protein
LRGQAVHSGTGMHEEVSLDGSKVDENASGVEEGGSLREAATCQSRHVTSPLFPFGRRNSLES